MSQKSAIDSTHSPATILSQAIVVFRFIGSNLILALFLGSVAQLDFMGTQSATNMRSEALFLRFFGGPFYESSAREKVSVILIDDSYLEVNKSFWPLSYVEQSGLLEEILDFEPHSIFLDFVYRHQHGTTSDFKELLETIKSKGPEGNTKFFIPQLLSTNVPGGGCKELNSGPNGTGPKPSDFVDLAGLSGTLEADGGATTTFVGWSGCPNRYPAYLLGDETLPTPAWALYKDYVKANEINADTASHLFKEEMMIRWGTGVSANQNRLLKKSLLKCYSFDEKTSWYGRPWYLIQQLYTAVKQSLSDVPYRGFVAGCAYVDTIHATWLLSADFETRALLGDMLKDRIVFVGTQVQGIHDYVTSPVNGKIPGVFLLATATENYLNYGSNYYRDPDDEFIVAVEISTLFVIFVIVGGCWKIYVARIKANESKKSRSLKSALLATLLFKLLLPLGLSLVVASVLWMYRVAPFNWIGISLLAFFANPVQFADCTGAGSNGILQWIATKLGLSPEEKADV